MIDLYIRPDEEDSSILEVHDYLYEFIEQVEVLLFTEPGEVLGSPDFGIDLERYVHELTINEYDLRRKISTQIKKWIPLAEDINYTVDVFFAKNSNGPDAALVNIGIEGNTLIGIVV